MTEQTVTRNGFVNQNGERVVFTDPTKANKAASPTSGNIATLDAQGNVVDSGIKPADLAPKIHTHGDFAYYDVTLANLQALVESIDARVLALETPVWSQTGIDITNGRYDNNITTNSDAYSSLEVGDQVKVEITFQGETTTIYTTVISKITSPDRVIFADVVYPTSGVNPRYSSVIIYKRVS